MSHLTEINVALVRKLVAAQFPQWSHHAIKPIVPDGWDNRTFRLGDHLTVRLPSAEAYAAQAEKEQYWLPRLARQLPLPIPIPVALGAPGQGYPWHWSVYRWLNGETATAGNIGDWNQFAASLADFLKALHGIDPARGPAPGRHNFFRGGSLIHYDGEVRQAITALQGRINTQLARNIWSTALKSTWPRAPVWLHGDIHATNLLVNNNRLSAVIDFGCAAMGDPACDYAIAWTLFLEPHRTTFRVAADVDDATWARGRGWALWKGLITLAGKIDSDQSTMAELRRTLEEILVDFRSTA